jgi:hypothetical protein
MEWLLLVVLLAVDDGGKYDHETYASETECITAAQEFVRQNPAFEWRDHRRPGGLIAPVMRPHVKCQPNDMSAE